MVLPHVLRVWHHTKAALPSVCQVCGAWPSRAVCVDCTQRFAHPVARCTRCAAQVSAGLHICGACLTHQEPASVSRCAAAVDYDYPWDGLIARFKFRGEVAWASTFAKQLCAVPEARSLMADTNLWVPVPLGSARLAERGYNQAWELVKALRQHVGMGAAPGIADALLRLGGLQDQPDQHALPRAQRLRNLRHAFAANPDHVPRLQQARVLLVDDVSTTGATLRAAAQTLQRAGAAEVNALVFARTGEQ